MQPGVKVEMHFVDSILSTIQRTQLMTLLPTLAVCRRETGLKAIVFIEPTPRRAVGLLWLQVAQQRTSAKAFAEVAASVLIDRKVMTRK